MVKKTVFFYLFIGLIVLTSCGKKVITVKIPIEQESQYKIGEDYMIDGKYESALEYFQEELKKLQQTNDQESYVASELYYNIGVCLNSLGETKTSIEYLEKAIELDSKYKRDARLVDDYLSVAIYYQSLEQYETSLTYMKKATELTNQLWGEDSLDAATMMKFTSFIYTDMGMNEEAIELLEKALEIQKKHYGESSDSIGRSYLGLGLVY